VTIVKSIVKGIALVAPIILGGALANVSAPTPGAEASVAPVWAIGGRVNAKNSLAIDATEPAPPAASGSDPLTADLQLSPAVARPVVDRFALDAKGPAVIPGAGPGSPLSRPLSRVRIMLTQQAPAAQPPQPPASQAPPGVPAPEQLGAGSRAPTRFTGTPVSLDFQDADLRAVLRTFSEISELNMIIDPSVKGTVDVSLRDVPWDQALDQILRANKLGYLVDGTIVRIAPLTALAEEEAQKRKLTEEQALAGELRVVTKTLSYARADALVALLTRSALSARGTVQVDPRTNTLIITDLPDRLQTASELITVLDRAEPQVEIEARIVNTQSTYARALGIQWGFQGRVDPTLGNTTNLAFPNSGTVGGRAGGGTPGTAVNLPPTGAATSAVGLALGAVNGAFNLDVALSALENSGKLRILSTPRVTTQNNVDAEITQGVRIPVVLPVPPGSAAIPTVSYIDAALTMRVKPQITAADTVIMTISVDNGSQGELAANGNRTINTQRANTTVLVGDGQTTVIGGIYSTSNLTSSGRTPGLSRIPIFKWLFKRDSVDDSDTELMIFITPHIIKG
jgi:type IV pilus assembly protein PilQ